jgi:Ca2+/H+ antiporter
MSQPAGIRRVFRDIADLCELQFELLAVDGKEALRYSITAIVMAVVAVVFGLSAVIGTVFAIATAFHENLGWTMSSSLFAAVGIAAIIAAVCAAIGVSFLKKATSALDETRAEFAENLRWIKASIVVPESVSKSLHNEENSNGRYMYTGRR